MALELPTELVGYDDYAALDDGNRYQVIDGVLVALPAPTRWHQLLVQEIWRALNEHVRTARSGEVYLAPFDVVLKAERPAVIVQPDVLYVSQPRLGIITEANVQGPPDLVVEVLSPGNPRLDTFKKLGLYARYGVSEVWFVPQDFDRIEIQRLLPDGQYGRPVLFLPGDTLQSAALPGLALAVSALFKSPNG